MFYKKILSFHFIISHSIQFVTKTFGATQSTVLQGFSTAVLYGNCEKIKHKIKF